MPSRRPFDDEESGLMAGVVIGVDPAKRSHTIEVIDDRERTLLVQRFDNDNAGYRLMRAAARRWPGREWAVEGATGVGLHLAQRLVSDGETVLDVPSKLSTRAPGVRYRPRPREATRWTRTRSPWSACAPRVCGW